MKANLRSVKAAAAFSLTEATLAMGIAAVGIMTILALVPTGLDLLRESAADIAEAKIVQAVATYYQMTDWGARSANMKPADKEFYFDQRGIEAQQNSFLHHFTARASVENANPTFSGDVSANRYLRRVVVKIAERTAGEGALDDPARHRRYGVLVTLTEQTGKL